MVHTWVNLCTKTCALYLHLPFNHMHTCSNAPYWVFLAVKAALWVRWHNIQVAALKHDSQGSTTENKSLVKTKPISCFGRVFLNIHELLQQVKALIQRSLQSFQILREKLYKAVSMDILKPGFGGLFCSCWNVWILQLKFSLQLNFVQFLAVLQFMVGSHKQNQQDYKWSKH